MYCYYVKVTKLNYTYMYVNPCYPYAVDRSGKFWHITNSLWLNSSVLKFLILLYMHL